MASTPVFRLFVSSTFADMRLERDALQRQVFPRLATLCSRRGARFLPVDLRWGVSEAVAQGQQTMRICLEEIARCQRGNLRPNFIALLGNRYGWRPLPAEIPLDDFALIRRSIGVGGGPAARAGLALLERWYAVVDANAVPPTRVLQPRPTDTERWTPIERALSRLLREATEGFAAPRRLRYVASSTEQEVMQGALLPGAGIEHAVCFLREIPGLTPDHTAARTYGDLDDAEDAGRRLEELKARVTQRLREHAIGFEARVRGRSLSADHIPAFVETAHATLACLIERELDRGGGVDEQAEERAAHTRFAQQRLTLADGRPAFVGRRGALASIGRHLRSTAPAPGVLSGPPGGGKTSLMARAAELAARQQPRPVVVQRYVGATPASTNPRELALSIAREIAAAYRTPPPPAGADAPALARSIGKLMERAGPQRPLILFVDDVDRLRGADDDDPLLWLPVRLPSAVRLIVSAAPGPTLEALRGRAERPRVLALGPMSEREGQQLLARWLAADGRRLQPAQVRAVMQRFRPEGLPLYLRLAFEQARRWRSVDPPDLVATVTGVVGSLFDRLAQRSAHGALVVARSLGYLACARHGMAEDEMAALLAGDAALQRDFRHRSPQSPPTPTLPPIVWSRLLFDLQPYLATRPGNGTLLLGFEHPEFEALARRRFAHGSAAKVTRRALVAHFDWPPVRRADGAASDRRRLSELPFQLAQGGRWGALTRLLLDISFLEAKVGATGPQSLVDELALVPGVGAGRPRTGRHTAALAELRDAVRLGASVLQAAPHELAAQMGGRLQDTGQAALRRLVAAALRRHDRDRLCPLRASLARPGPLLRTLRGHALHVGCLAMTPDGTLLASGSNDNSVRVWNAASGTEVRRLSGHRNWVKAVAIAPDGQTVVSGGLDRTLRLWDLRSAGAPRVLRFGAPVTSIRMFPDGRRFALAVGNRIEIRRLPDGATEGWAVRTRHANWSIALSPAGDRIAAVSWAGGLRVWSLAGNEPPLVLQPYDFEASRIYEAADEIGTEGGPRRWEDYSQLAFSHDGAVVYASSTDHQLRGRALATREEVAKWPLGRDRVNVVAAAPGGRWIAGGADDGTVRLWRPRRGTCTVLRGHSAGVQDIAFAGDGHTMASSGTDATLCLWDLRRAQEQKSDHPREVAAVLATPGLLVSASEWHGSSDLRFWSRAGRPLRRLECKEWVSALAFIPERRFLVLGGMELNLMTAAGRTRLRYAGGNRGDGSTIGALAVSPDGRYLVDAGWGENARLWDLRTIDLTRYPRLAEIQCLGPLELYTTWLAISRDSRWAIGSSKEGIRLVPIGHAAAPRTIAEPDGVERAILAPDGKALLGRTEKGQCKLWSLGKRRPARVFERDLGTPVGFTPDGASVVCRRDTSVLWWDLGTGGLLSSFTAEAPIRTCSLSPDGSTVIAGDPTGRVHILRLRRPNAHGHAGADSTSPRDGASSPIG